MRKTFIGGVAAQTLAALALAAVAGAGAASAQTPAQTPAQAAQPRAHVLRGDGDGRISRAEFVDGRLARLTAADANGDGSVAPEERRAVFQARRAEQADKRFSRLDADGNGAISRAEFDAPRAERAQGPHSERAARRGGRHAFRAARHGPRGAQAARDHGPVVIADVRARLDERFGKLDADGDGFVTVEERQAAAQAHRQARRERFQARRTQQPASPAPASE